MWSSVVAAAHLRVFVNGRLLGWTTGFQPRVATPVRPAQGIDQPQTFELMPTTYRVMGSMDVLRGRLTGGLEGLGLVASGRDLLKQKYKTIEIVDRVTDTTFFKATGCVVTDQTIRIAPKGIVVISLQFEGLDATNEADL